MSPNGERGPQKQYPVMKTIRFTQEQADFLESVFGKDNFSEAIRAALDFARAHEEAFRAWVESHR